MPTTSKALLAIDQIDLLSRQPQFKIETHIGNIVFDLVSIYLYIQISGITQHKKNGKQLSNILCKYGHNYCLIRS